MILSNSHSVKLSANIKLQEQTLHLNPDWTRDSLLGLQTTWMEPTYSRSFHGRDSPYLFLPTVSGICTHGSRQSHADIKVFEIAAPQPTHLGIQPLSTFPKLHSHFGGAISPVHMPAREKVT